MWLRACGLLWPQTFARTACAPCPVPRTEQRALCVEATKRLCGQRVCGSHTEAVWQPQRLWGSHTGPGRPRPGLAGRPRPALAGPGRPLAGLGRPPYASGRPPAGLQRPPEGSGGVRPKKSEKRVFPKMLGIDAPGLWGPRGPLGASGGPLGGPLGAPGGPWGPPGPPLGRWPYFPMRCAIRTYVVPLQYAQSRSLPRAAGG